MQKKKKASGFTLVGLVVALGMSLILSFFAVPIFNSISKVDRNLETAKNLAYLKNRIVSRLDCKETLNRNSSQFNCTQPTVVSLWEKTSSGRGIEIVSRNLGNLTRSGKLAILAQTLCGNNGIVVRGALLKQGISVPNSISDSKWTSTALYSADPMSGKTVTFFDPQGRDVLFADSLTLCKVSVDPRSIAQDLKDTYRTVTDRTTSAIGYIPGSTNQAVITSCNSNEIIIGCSFTSGSDMSIPHALVTDYLRNRCYFNSSLGVYSLDATVTASCSRYK